MAPDCGGRSTCGVWRLFRYRLPLLQEVQSLVDRTGVIDAQLCQPGQSLERLMGGGLYATKTVSSLTLFEAAGLESAGALLDRIGRRCTPTLEQLAHMRRLY